MADFVAVLKKTVEGLSENTPEVRARVYNKARATIQAKLAALSPPLPDGVAERQRQALEDAIRVVEQAYEPPVEPELDELDNFFGNYASEPDAVPASDPQAGFEPTRGSLPRVDPFALPEQDQARYPNAEGDHQVGDDAAENDAVEADEIRFERIAAPVSPQTAPRRRLSNGLIAAVLALVVLGGGAYALWLNQDAFTALLGQTTTAEDGIVRPADVAEGTDIPDDAAVNGEEGDAAEIASDDNSQPLTEGTEEQDVAAADPQGLVEDVPPADDAASQDAAKEPDATTDPAGEPIRKYTQRLQPDGTEVDAGPANGGVSIGEGTSVAELTQLAQAEQPAAPANPAPAGAPAPSAPAGESVAVGQRAIFYQERTATAAASADSGSLVWSVVQESPGGDAPPEPAIRAEVMIPAKDLQLRMTIRRNADPTLPASHIMEMIFLTPEGVEGGGIENVVRVALKDTEQSTGSPLLGIPARIADGFFLVALSDSPAEVQANMTLLRRQDWIDIPLIYKSGRRALITLEKGIPGGRVFEEVMRAWPNTTAG
ncbi:MAG TPA: hypothetical protein VGN98_09870 [Tianweitania sediminis]|jgi:hypothetical protein|nr:hypothetical protein [Tianweitania sediminis]